MKFFQYLFLMYFLFFYSLASGAGNSYQDMTFLQCKDVIFFVSKAYELKKSHGLKEVVQAYDAKLKTYRGQLSEKEIAVYDYLNTILTFCLSDHKPEDAAKFTQEKGRLNDLLLSQVQSETLKNFIQQNQQSFQEYQSLSYFRVLSISQKRLEREKILTAFYEYLVAENLSTEEKDEIELYNNILFSMAIIGEEMTLMQSSIFQRVIKGVQAYLY